MDPNWTPPDAMTATEAVALLLDEVPEFKRYYEVEVLPTAIGDDGQPLLHAVFGDLAFFYKREVATAPELLPRFWQAIERLAEAGGRYVADDALAGSFIEHFCLGEDADQRLIKEAAPLQGPATRRYVEFYWRGLAAEPKRLARRLEKARRRAAE